MRDYLSGRWRGRPLAGDVDEVTKMHIRRASASDLPAMQEIARRTIDACYRSFLGDGGVDWFIGSGESDRELERHLAHCDVLLDDATPIAFAIHFDDLIHLMMVDVTRHRRGIGSLLLAHCETQLLADGNDVIRLETIEGNVQAIRFYEKNGWTQVATQLDEEHGFVRVLFEKRE